MQSAAAALERLTDEASKVSSHYLIDEDGTVYRLVAEAHRAQHAGVSFWLGERDINSRSIGIEIVNPGHEWGYRPFHDVQMTSLKRLSLELLERHSIPPHRVLGHSDVAPTRKEDPGELFDWRGLSTHGIGLWPQPVDAEPIEGGTPALLARYGYETGDEAITRASLAAFQRHFRPARFDGVDDAESNRLLAALCRQAEL